MTQKPEKEADQPQRKRPKYPRHGASNVEYGILLGLVSVLAIVAVTGMGQDVRDVFSTTADRLAGGEGETAPTPDAGPYGGWIDENGFMMGTPEIDTLNLSIGGPWTGVYGLASDDEIDGTSSGEIFIGGLGNDNIDGRGGDDTYVYKKGDGSDAYQDSSGTADRLVLTDINREETSFKHYANGVGLQITVPGGVIDNLMHSYAPTSSNYAWEEIEFGDGTVFGIRETVIAAYEDQKALGASLIELTGFDEDLVHDAAKDGTYQLKWPGGTDRIFFKGLNYDDVAFRATSNGTDLRIHEGKSSGSDRVDLNMMFYPAASFEFWMETIEFEDGVIPERDIFLQRVAEDAKPFGEVNFTPFNDYLRHFASTDGGYKLKGHRDGQDELRFMETSFEDAEFDVYYSDMRIQDAADNWVNVGSYFHASYRDWVETISFNGGAQKPTFDQMKDRAIHDQKATGKVDLTSYDDEIRHERSKDSSYSISNGNGVDTLHFLETTHQEVEFTKYWSDLRIHLPASDNGNPAHAVTVGTYLSGCESCAQGAMENIIFKGEPVTREYIVSRVDDGPYVDPTAAPMQIRYNLDSPDDHIEIPLTQAANVIIDWGDATANANCETRFYNVETAMCHEGTHGSRTVKITGHLPEWKKTGYDRGETYSGAPNGTPAPNYWPYVVEDIVAVESWGDTGLTNLIDAFAGAPKLTSVPADLPSTVTRIDGMFSGADSFNSANVSNWDISNVTNISSVFAYNDAFNQPLNWNTSGVTNMSRAFEGATAFNQNISSWKTGNVLSTAWMFDGATSFNQPLNTVGANWDTSSVETMQGMFEGATSFNQPLSNWNTSSAYNMAEMFKNTGFNQDISGWETGAVKHIGYMFQNATVFNQDLSGWCVSYFGSNPDYDGFDDGATSWTLPRPNWGSCPP